MGVGHTHTDIDRLFSYLNAALRAMGDVFTRDDFAKAFRTAMADKKDTMLLDHIMEDLSFSFDFWSYIKPHLYKVLVQNNCSCITHLPT